MAFHPLGLLPTNDKAFAASLARLERLGPRNWMGYSFAWMAGLYALAGDGVRCAEKLHQFTRGFTDANSFHTNGEVGGEGLTAWPFNAFTLEGNCAAMAATQDMLLQSREGVVHVFPALPPDWRSASFEGFRADGGILVSAAYDAGRAAIRLEGPPGLEILIRIGADPSNRRVALDASGRASYACDWTEP